MRVHGLTGKVAALAEHGGVLAAHARVEVVLADALHHVLRGAVEQVPLVQEPVHLRHVPRHVLLLPVRRREENRGSDKCSANPLVVNIYELNTYNIVKYNKMYIFDCKTDPNACSDIRKCV